MTAYHLYHRPNYALRQFYLLSYHIAIRYNKGDLCLSQLNSLLNIYKLDCIRNMQECHFKPNLQYRLLAFCIIILYFFLPSAICVCKYCKIAAKVNDLVFIFNKQYYDMKGLPLFQYYYWRMIGLDNVGVYFHRLD